MAEENLFEELKNSLSEFKQFLDTNVPVIKPAITALKGLGVPVDELVNQLVTLLGQLKTEIQNLDVGAIPGLEQVSTFTGSIGGLLDAAETLVPSAGSQIAEVRRVAGLVSSLPTLDQVKTEIISLIDAITAHLNSLNN